MIVLLTSLTCSVGRVTAARGWLLLIRPTCRLIRAAAKNIPLETQDRWIYLLETLWVQEPLSPPESRKVWVSFLDHVDAATMGLFLDTHHSCLPTRDTNIFYQKQHKFETGLMGPLT